MNDQEKQLSIEILNKIMELELAGVVRVSRILCKRDFH